MQSENLKPCPFCGSSDVHLRQDQLAEMSWVSCVGCGLEAPTETGVSDDDAVAYWNRRTEATLSTDAGQVSFEQQNYNCPCIHPSQCDETCVKTAPAVAVKEIAPVDVYRALSSFVENDTFDKEHVSAISRSVAAALSAQVQDVAGLELRPHEPTKEMLAAAMKADQDGMPASMKTIWMVMWAAYSASPASKHGDAE